MNTENLFTILFIVFVFCILIYVLILFIRSRYLKLINSLQVLEELPENVYIKDPFISKTVFYKDTSMKTFVFCFNYVFVGVVHRYLKFLGMFIPYSMRINTCKSGLHLTKFESIFNLFLENTSKEIKNGDDLYVFLNTLENCPYKEVINSFVNKDLIYKLKKMSFN